MTPSLHLAVAGSERDRAPTIAAASRGWKTWLQAQDYSPDSQQRYIDTIEGIAKDCGWESVLDAITSEIGHWLAEQKVENDWSGRTYNNRLAAIRTFFEWVKTNKWRGENPAAALACVKHIEGDGVREFELDQMRAIIAAAEGRRRAAYIIGATTGLRKSNVMLRTDLPKNALRWGWVYLEEAMLRFPGGTVKKKSKAFEIPLTGEGVEALRAIKPADAAPDTIVFPFWVDNRTLRDDMERAGVPYLNEHGEPAAFHSFRKGYLTAIADTTDNPKILQDLAGHSDLKTTMRYYVRANLAKRRAAVQNFSVLPNPAQTRVCENPAGSGPEKCVDTGPRRPFHGAVTPTTHPIEADSPAAPCESRGRLASHLAGTRTAGGRRAVSDRVSPAPTSEVTPRGFEPQGITIRRGANTTPSRQGTETPGLTCSGPAADSEGKTPAGRSRPWLEGPDHVGVAQLVEHRCGPRALYPEVGGSNPFPDICEADKATLREIVRQNALIIAAILGAIVLVAAARFVLTTSADELERDTHITGAD